MASARQVVRHGVMVVGGLAVGLVLLEGVVRMLNLAPASDYRAIFETGGATHMRPDAAMVEVQAEYTVPIAINHAGYRDAEFVSEKRPGVPRIAAVGDSFTFGTGVEQTMRTTEVLERLLKQAGRTVEVYNFGVPGTETETQIPIVQDAVLPYRPDYLLIMFYLGNDVVDNVRVAAGQRKIYESARSPGARLIDWYREHSRLYQFVLTRAARSETVRALYNRLKTAGRWGEVSNQVELFAGETDPRLWEPTFAALRRMTALCRVNGIQPVLVLLPARIQYDDVAWERFAHELNGQAATGRSRPNEVLTTFAAEQLHLPVIDPLPAFRAAQHDGARMYYEIDGHLTPAGHRVLAEAIAAALLRI